MNVNTTTLTTLILEDARARYAAHPDHTPYGQCSDYCVVVAIDWGKRIHKTYNDEPEEALAHAANVYGMDLRTTLIQWNAAASTEEVLAAFDRAIEEQEAVR